MAYAEHKSCNTPKDSQQIWRYMDFAKFVSMLEDGTLFFSNLAQLDDPLEGYPTKRTIEQFNNRVSHKQVPGVGDMNRSIKDSIKKFRKHTYVSCWCMNDYESPAMWKVYSKNGEGVAIQSTVGRLKKSLEQAKINFRIDDFFIGEVKYLDEKDEGPMDGTISLATHKRKSFEHEKEVRVIILDKRNTKGVCLSVDIDILIEKVFVSPSYKKWEYNLLKKLITRYGLNKEVLKSTLEQTPPF
jgi:hypothetical protein